jgi:Mrp family chromosome partitioning ATPase
VQELAATYDQVVLDTPPVLAVSDAYTLINLVDQVLFVIRWERTRREVVGSALEMIERARAGMTSIVLSRVNMRKHSKYSYGDSGQYYKEYSRYYSN